VNQFEAPKDNAEVLQLIRENDSLGAESSLWLRAIRQLTKEGKPIGQIFAITVPIGDGKKMPIGMLTLTDANRLVFWSVLPRQPCAVFNKPGVPLPDHITVEFPSEKVHATSYRSNGRPIHVRESWRSAPIDSNGLRLLFMFLVRRSILAEQDILISRKFEMPTTDSDRRTAEITQSVQRVMFYHLPVPGNVSEQDYFYLSIFRASKVLSAEELPASLLPRSGAVEMVTDWPDNVEFPIIVGQLSIYDQNFCVAAGCPPGRLKDPLGFGFPRRSAAG